MLLPFYRLWGGGGQGACRSAIQDVKNGRSSMRLHPMNKSRIKRRKSWGKIMRRRRGTDFCNGGNERGRRSARRGHLSLAGRDEQATARLEVEDDQWLGHTELGKRTLVRGGGRRLGPAQGEGGKEEMEGDKKRTSSSGQKWRRETLSWIRPK